MDQIKELLTQCKSKAEEVNHLRKYEESERHWYCRKSFLLKNWDDFNDDNRHMLECWSICWANLHFLGTNYPIQGDTYFIRYISILNLKLLKRYVRCHLA